LVDSICINGIENVAELVFLENSDIDIAKVFFIDINDMGRRYVIGNEPLLSSFPFFAINISEGLGCLQKESCDFSDDSSAYDFLELLVNSCDIETWSSDQPFFSSLSLDTSRVFASSDRLYFESCVGRDD